MLLMFVNLLLEISLYIIIVKIMVLKIILGYRSVFFIKPAFP